ncbi:MAG: L-2-amino-thiazoline-4-carboxylic acid hydrolase [Sandaracinus sp.]
MANLDRVEGLVWKELAGWSTDLRDALAEQAPALSADAVLDRTRERLAAMLPTIADPGVTAPQMRAFTVGGAIYVAVYLALHAEGWDAARAWQLLERATALHFERMSGLDKRLASDGMFSWPMKALSRWLAGKSQRAPVGGWVFEFHEPDAESDYGVTYTRCAIRELAIAHGAAEFAPYICLSDITGSRIFGWCLTRTETLAQGGSRCDFRFKRHGETRVRVHLPVAR